LVILAFGTLNYKPEFDVPPRNVVLNVILGNKNCEYYTDKLVFVIQQEHKPKAPTNKEITRTNQLDTEWDLSLTLVKGENPKLKFLRWL
jgi:hypothetical protein